MGYNSLPMSIEVTGQEMIDEQILLIITSELTGQASEEDIQILQDWLDESRENVSLYHSYKEAFINGKYNLELRNADAAFNRLTKKLDFEHNANDSGYVSRLRNVTRFLHLSSKFAAILLVLVVSIWVIYYTQDSWKVAEPTDEQSDLIVKSNPRGVKSLVTLPDGSKVKLNSESHIEYNSDFASNRSIKLVGEAYFDVEKDSLSPFTVKTGEISIRVLGTSFNVQAFPFEKDINIALVEGLVVVEKQKNLSLERIALLEPSQMLSYNYKESDFTIDTFESDRILAWIDGELIFVNTEFDEVVKTLERWYGVEISVDRDVKIHGGYTGNYKNEKLESVMDGLKFAYGFDYSLDRKKVFIKK